jgi:GTP-binding protein
MRELASFSEELAAKPMMVIATKLDAAQDSGRIESLRALAEERGLEFHAVSAVTGEGLSVLMHAVADAIRAKAG